LSTLNGQDSCIIAGIGETAFSRDSRRSELSLALEAIHKAVDDAGLEIQEIDGIISYSLDTTASPGYLALNLGIPSLSYWGETDGGGGATCGVIAQATAAIGAGLARNVVVYRAMNGRSGRRLGQAWSHNPCVGGPDLDEYALPFGVLAPVQLYALKAAEYIRRFGVTSEQLGWIAVVTRARANANPFALMYGRPMSIADHQASPLVAAPLRLLDCCLETDNAAAVVVTAATRHKDLPHKAALIMAAEMASAPTAHGPAFYSPFEPDLTQTAAHHLAPRLYAAANVTPDDIDVAQLYDSFTITVLSQLEAYGFCGRGDGGPFVDGGQRIDLNGDIPINTYGGQLSGGYVNGFSGILEGVRQIRGTSTNQIPGAQLCLVTGGALAITSGMILGVSS
jgi:acetyl-CoA acetyltransferase